MTSSRAILWMALASTSTAVAAQDADLELRADLDTLLEGDSIDVVLFDLPERFFGHVMLLVPGLTPEDQGILAGAIDQAFEPLMVRTRLVDFMADTASLELVQPLVASRDDGPEAEMHALLADHEPEQPFDAWVSALDDPPADRIQHMAELADARGAGDFDILLDQALGAAAYRLVTRLGVDPGPFRPLSDEAFEAGYRQRLLSRALELVHAMGPVPDSLVARVLDVYASQPGRWYVDRRAAAMQESVIEAGRRAEELVVPAEAVAETPPTADSDLPCRSTPCGYVVEWQGSPPTGTNRRFGAAGDLDARVMQHLALTGYQLTRGLSQDGLTIRLRPRTMTALCDFMSGTDNRGCQAIDNVRVDFLGTHPDAGTVDGFLVRNRCGSGEVMDVDGFSAFLASRLHHGLSGHPSAERPGPPC